MQIPILNGIASDSVGDIRTSYPVNLRPVPTPSGISNGYLAPGEGVVKLADLPGIDRGGCAWRGAHYRVIDEMLYRFNARGEGVPIGAVFGQWRVVFTYGFDYLGIASGGDLYLCTEHSVQRVTDPDIGRVISVQWIDGYYMTTDGEYLVVTELNDPFSVNPLKYGSSEADPDPIVALCKIRNEIYAINRHTIEVFDNVGGSNFPFARVEGAQIMKGAIGPHAQCVFMDTVAFVGSGRNEPCSVYMGMNASAVKVATQEIDAIIQSYPEEVLSLIILEARVDRNHSELWVRLPDRTLVYDANASAAMQSPVWFSYTSAKEGFSQHLVQGLTWVYDKWHCAHTQRPILGTLTSEVSSHWGEQVRWEFNTLAIYNESKGALINKMELVALTGRVEIENNPRISTSYSLDGQTWSQQQSIPVGKIGARNTRLVWWRCGSLRSYRMQRFQGDSDAHISFLRLECDIEALRY